MIRTHSNVEFIGEINEHDKADFLGDAAALLFPVDWPEPFGLVMIEAMACGTPVIAFRRGSVPEIVEEGSSGFVVDTIEQAADAVRRIASLDRAKIRAEFERRFTVERMVRDYLEIYRTLAAVHVAPAPRLAPRTLRSQAARSVAAELVPAGATGSFQEGVASPLSG
jgi:glycosyltransferase involved in cell wall biosynthesis